MALVPLPPSITEPLYVRLKIALRDLIGKGLGVGDRLPTEIELCREYGLSRITVRQALNALVNEGAIERKQGRGTFVAAPKQAESVPYFGSFTEEVAADGHRGSTRLVSAAIVNADARVASRLQIPLHRPTWKIRRIRMSDGRPVCYQVSYVPQALLPNALRTEFRYGSLYEFLERALGEPISDAGENIQAMLADPYRAALLDVRPGAPLLVLERTVSSKSGRIVEYNRSFYNALTVHLTLRSKRGAAAHGQSRLRFSTEPDGIAIND
ncbi:MAG: GntR family transcriptional regulator [Acetobacteraceae bacterium]